MTAKTHDVPTSFRRRAGAYAIDSALIFVIWLAAVMLSEIPDTTDDPEPWSTIAATVVVSLPALWFVYQWTCNATGVTIGKKFLSLRIRSTVARPRPEFSLSTDQRRPGVGDGFVRTIGQAVGLLPLGLKYLWSSWDAHDQTWHDKLSSTLVVRILESPAGVSIENESMYG